MKFYIPVNSRKMLRAFLLIKRKVPLLFSDSSRMVSNRYFSIPSGLFILCSNDLVRCLPRVLLFDKEMRFINN